MRDGLGVLDAWVCCVGDVYGSQAPGPLVCVGNLWGPGCFGGVCDDFMGLKCLGSLCTEGIYEARTPGALVKGVPMGPGRLGPWPMSCHPQGDDSSTLPGLYWDTAVEWGGDGYLVPPVRRRGAGMGLTDGGSLAAVPEHRVHFVIKEVTSVPAR